MGKFGEKLRREREMRAVTLEEIAEATKIGTRSLKALEDENFKILPGGIFNKGFVRAYARYLGLDQEQAVNDYLVAAEEQQPSNPELPEPKVVVSQAEEARQRKDALEAASGKPPSGSWKSFVVLLLVIAVIAAGWKYYELRKAAKAAAEQAAIVAQLQAAREQIAREEAAKLEAAKQQASEEQTAQEQAAKDQAAAKESAVQTPAAAEIASISPEFQVQIRAKQKLWLKVTADGKVVENRTIDPEEEHTYNAKAKLVLISGKPGGFEIQWNGRKLPIPPVTTNSQTLVFTQQGLEP